MRPINRLTNFHYKWSSYYQLQTLVHILGGNLITMNSQQYFGYKEMELCHQWLEEIMDIFVLLFTLVFILAVLATCYQIKIGVSQRDGCHDIFDHAFLLKKNSQNLEIQEIRNMGQQIGAALSKWYKHPKSCWSWYRDQLKKIRKFKQELGFEFTKPVVEIDTQQSKMLIVSYKA